MNSWIDFKKKRPEDYEWVIFLASRSDDKYNQNKQFVGYIEERDRVSCVFGDGWVPFSVDDITHWMPLPRLPL